MTDAPDALPRCGRCHPQLANLATRLDEAVWWCSRCGRLWTPETGADYQPPRDAAGEVTATLVLGGFEVLLLLRVVDQYVREQESKAVPPLERLLNLRDKLAEALGRLRSLVAALRQQGTL